MAGLQQQGCRCGRVASCGGGDGPSQFPAVVVGGARHGVNGLFSAVTNEDDRGKKERTCGEESLREDKAGMERWVRTRGVHRTRFTEGRNHPDESKRFSLNISSKLFLLLFFTFWFYFQNILTILKICLCFQILSWNFKKCPRFKRKS